MTRNAYDTPRNEHDALWCALVLPVVADRLLAGDTSGVILWELPWTAQSTVEHRIVVASPCQEARRAPTEVRLCAVTSIDVKRWGKASHYVDPTSRQVMPELTAYVELTPMLFLPPRVLKARDWAAKASQRPVWRSLGRLTPPTRAMLDAAGLSRRHLHHAEPKQRREGRAHEADHNPPALRQPDRARTQDCGDPVMEHALSRSDAHPRGA